MHTTEHINESLFALMQNNGNLPAKGAMIGDHQDMDIDEVIDMSFVLGNPKGGTFSMSDVPEDKPMLGSLAAKLALTQDETDSGMGMSL